MCIRDSPEPGGPVNSQEWVIAYWSAGASISNCSRADAAADKMTSRTWGASARRSATLRGSAG